MDMIGRSEEHVDRTTGKLKERAKSNLNSLHLDRHQEALRTIFTNCACSDERTRTPASILEWDEEDVFFRSDHANFARKDIPIAFFFTGFHRQYHRPDDTVDRIDFPKLARVAQLVYAVGFEVADRDERPVRDRLWSEIPRPNRRRR